MKIYRLLFLLALGTTPLRPSSLYLQPKYCGAYIAPSGSVILTSNASLTQQLVSQVPTPRGSSWSINTAIGSNGFINPTIQAARIVTPLSGPLVIGSNGNFAVGGTSNFTGVNQGFVARYLSSGIADTSFGTAGVYSFQANAHSTVVQCYYSDGSGGYYVGGYDGISSQGIITHVTSTGTLDGTFGTAGYVQPVGSIGVAGVGTQSGTGKIVYVANSGVAINQNGFTVNRISSTGGADGFTSYVGTTMVPKVLAIDSQNRIVVVGNNAGETTLYVYRLVSNGGLDPSFAASGVYMAAVRNPRVGGLAVLSDNSILVGYVGNAGNDMYVLKLTSAGVLDATFGTNGVATIPAQQGTFQALNSVVALSQGSIVVTAKDGNFYCVAVLNADGSFDSLFSIPGQVTQSGVAEFQIPNGTTGGAYGAGYISGTNNLVVAGTSTTGTFGAVFYDVGS